MTYQVLARKWRPKDFASLVGQEHVVRALTHALDGGRLHHAYLFTGTRGVGKTTLSRIFAKALNCETGVTSTPCGVCRACREIDEGRFIDYVEMDAASNRGVDEMAALLERAVYAPVDARFKVYMIDEVHMLTNHAFNAMLKTLEEPPSHVKFILATTDPQKIPVTVLSRCLQFNLKQMPAGHIVSHLEHILGEEHVPFDAQALRLLARAADGSMRDALSLTDQAIAYSANQVNEEAVRGMLGALDQSYLIRLLDALADGDGAAVLAVADEMALRSLSFPTALQDLASLLHRIAWAQFAPSSVLDEWPEAGDLRRFADALSAERVQLFYQIATIGRSELGLAPDEYAGFTMTLLRMLAFEPAPTGGGGVAGSSGAAARSGASGAKRSGAAVAAQSGAASARTVEAAGVTPRVVPTAQVPQVSQAAVPSVAAARIAAAAAVEANDASSAQTIDRSYPTVDEAARPGSPEGVANVEQRVDVADAQVEPVGLALAGDEVGDAATTAAAATAVSTPDAPTLTTSPKAIAAVDRETALASPAPQALQTGVLESSGTPGLNASSSATTGVAHDAEAIGLDTSASADALDMPEASIATEDASVATDSVAAADVGTVATIDPVAVAAAVASADVVDATAAVATGDPIAATAAVASADSIAATAAIASADSIAIAASTETETPPQPLTAPAAAAIARSEAALPQQAAPTAQAVAADVPPRRAGGASAALDVLRSAGLKVSSDRGRPTASASAQPGASKPAAPRPAVSVPTPGAARRAPQQDAASTARAQSANPAAQRNDQRNDAHNGHAGDQRNAPSTQAASTNSDQRGNADQNGSSIPPWDDIPLDDYMPLSASDEGYFGPPDDGYMPVFDSGPDDLRVSAAAPALAPAPVVDKRPLPPAVPLDPLGFAGDWPALAVDLPLKGISYQLAFNSELMALEGDTLKLNVPVQQYAEASQVAKLKAALADRLGRQVDVLVEVGPARRTAAAHDAAVRARRQQDAEREIGADPFVQSLIREFGASIVPGSIRPLGAIVPGGSAGSAGSAGAHTQDAGRYGASSTH